MENTSQKHRSQSVESGSADLSSPSVTHRTQPVAHTSNSFSPSTDRLDSDYHPNKRKASTSSDGHLRSPSIPATDPHDHKRLKNLDNTSPIRSKSPSSVHSGSSGVAQNQNSRSTQVLENIDAQISRDPTRVSSGGASLPRISSEYKESSESVTASDQALGQIGVLEYSTDLRNSPQPTLPLPPFRLPSMSSSFPPIHSRTTSPPSLQSSSGSFSYPANSMSPSGSTGGSVLTSVYEGQRSSPSPKPSFPPIRSMPQYPREVPILPPISSTNLNSESEVLGGSREYEERRLVNFHQQHPLEQFTPALKVEEQGSATITHNRSNIGTIFQADNEPHPQTTFTTNINPKMPQAKYSEAETASEEEEEIMETGGVVNRGQSVVSSRGETPLSAVEPSAEHVPKPKDSEGSMDVENGSKNGPQLIIRNNKLYDVMKSEDFHLGYTVYSPLTTLPVLEGKENGLLEVRIPGIYLSFSNTKVRKQAVWGTDVYTDDSDVVAALIHSGFYTPPLPNSTNGDLKLAIKNVETLPHANHDLSVTIRVMPKLIKYASTVRYRIKSREWGDHDGVSFKIESVKVLKFGEALRKGRKQRKQFIKANELIRKRVMNCIMTNNPHFVYTGLYETSVSIIFNQNNVPCYKYHPNLILALQQEDAEEAPVWNLNRFEQDILCLENTKNSYHLIRVQKSDSSEGESSDHYRLKTHAPNTFDFTCEPDFVSLQWEDINWVNQGILITSKCEPHQIEMLKGKVVPQGILIPINFMYWITPEIIDRIKTTRLEKELAQKEPSPIAHEPKASVPPVVEPEAESSTQVNSKPAIDSQENLKPGQTLVGPKSDISSDYAETAVVSIEIKENPDLSEDKNTIEDTIKDVVMVDSAAVTDEMEIPVITKIEEVNSNLQEDISSIQVENIEANLPTNPESQEVSILEEKQEGENVASEVTENPEERKSQDNVEIVIKQLARPVVNDHPDTNSSAIVESITHEESTENTEPMDIIKNNETIESNPQQPENETQTTNATEIQMEMEGAMQLDVELQTKPTNQQEDQLLALKSEVEDGEIESDVCEPSENIERSGKSEVVETKPEGEENLNEELVKLSIPLEHIPNDKDLRVLDKAKDLELVSLPKSEIEIKSDAPSNSVDGDEKAHSSPDKSLANDEKQDIVEESTETHEPEDKAIEDDSSRTEIVYDPDTESNVATSLDEPEDEKVEEGEISPLSENIPRSKPKVPEITEPQVDIRSEAEKQESKESSDELEAGEISPEAMDVDSVLESELNVNDAKDESTMNTISEPVSSSNPTHDQDSKDKLIVKVKSMHESPNISRDPEPGEIGLSGNEGKESGELEAKDITAHSPKSRNESDMEEGEIDDDEGLIDPRSSIRSSQSTYRGPDYKYKSDDFRKVGPKDLKLKEKGEKSYGFYDRPERFKERFDYRRDDRKFERGRDRVEEYKPYRREDRPRDRARYERRDDMSGVRSRNERYDRFSKTHERSSEFREDKDHPHSSKSHGSTSSDNEEGELTDQPSPSANLSKPTMDKDTRSSQESSRRLAESTGNEKEHTKESSLE